MHVKWHIFTKNLIKKCFHWEFQEESRVVKWKRCCLFRENVVDFSARTEKV